MNRKMKKLRIFLPILLSMIILLNLTSCILFVKEGKGKGNHNGWYKNPHNPHNPFHNGNKGNNGNNGNGHGNGHHKK